MSFTFDIPPDLIKWSIT